MFGSNYFGQPYFGQAYPSLPVGVPTWVTPLNHATGVNQTAELVFQLPQAEHPMHFEIQYDTSSNFNTGSLVTAKSWVSQTGWEYYNGSSWVAFPSTGVPIAYAGNQARYTTQSSLSATTWYRRIRGRVRI